MATDGIEAACLERPHAQPLTAGSPSTVFVRDQAVRSAVETERDFKEFSSASAGASTSSPFSAFDRASGWAWLFIVDFSKCCHDGVGFGRLFQVSLKFFS